MAKKSKTKKQIQNQASTQTQETVTVVKTPRIKLPEAKLRFSPTAWYKILYMRESVNVEVSGFGISSKEDPLFVQDFVLIKQVSSMASTDMDDESVANHMENMAELGYQPAECMRIWIHTHPANSATPSSTDEATFVKAFGNCNWSVMFIMAEGGVNTAHMMFNAGVKSVFKIPTCIDYNAEIIKEWDEEIAMNVEEYVYPTTVYGGTNYVVGSGGKKNNHYPKYDPKYYNYLSEKNYDYGYGFDELMDDDGLLPEDFLEDEKVPV
jgi:proteasome lid subunit RPN8/RPN11